MNFCISLQRFKFKCYFLSSVYFDTASDFILFASDVNDVDLLLQVTDIATRYFIFQNTGPGYTAFQADNILASSLIHAGDTDTRINFETNEINILCGNTTIMHLISDKLGIFNMTPAAALDVVGDARFGDSSTNYTEFKSDGELNLHGTARTIRHLRVGSASWKGHGVNAPTENIEGVFFTIDFDAASDDEVWYTLIVPSRWDTSTDVEFAVDWFYDGILDNGTVCWALEYKGIKDAEAVAGAGTTITQTSAGVHRTGYMVRTTFTTKILAANLEAGDTLGFRLYRDVSADTLAADARLLNTHFHFTQNKLGKAT